MNSFTALAVGLLLGVLTQNVVHRKLRTEVDALLAAVAASTYVDGWVDDAGGGVVRVVVDRETMQYPTVGARCRLLEFDAAH